MPVSLGLGTAQFGLPYGVTNDSGIPSDSELSVILDLASKIGIAALDTAAAYGDAEVRLGSQNAASSFNVVTKLTSLSQLNPSNIEKTVLQSVSESLRRLKAVRVHGILLHDVKDLDSPYASEIVAALTKLKTEGLAAKVGISAYTADDISKACALFDPDIVQCPCNIFDQRLLTGNVLQSLEERGVEIHIRSIFLQGLLLREPVAAPPGLVASLPHVRRWHQYLKERDIDPIAAALAFGRSLPKSATILVGVSTVKELQQIGIAWSKAVDQEVDFCAFASTDAQLIDPRCWARK